MTLFLSHPRRSHQLFLSYFSSIRKNASALVMTNYLAFPAFYCFIGSDRTIFL
jgi:hypothetical protein